jgi:hypothetical protein
VEYPRSAIASPYLTYEQQHRRDRMFAALLHARKDAFSSLNVRLIFPHCCNAGAKSGQSTSQCFFNQLLQKALPRLELVAKNTSAQVLTATYQPVFSVVILIPG